MIRTVLGSLPVVMTAATACALADSSVAPTTASQGASLFAAHCVVCHGGTGAGVPSLAPPLTTNPARYAQITEGRRQLAMTVLYGLFGEVTVNGEKYNFKMPEFSQLDDASLAEVLNYVVFEVAKAPASARPLTAGDIAAERSRVVDGQAVRQHRSSVLTELGPAK